MAQDPKTHPVLFTVLSLSALVILGVVLWHQTATWKIGGEEFFVNYTLYIIPSFILLIILLLLIDLGAKGRVVRFIGRRISWGYPTFGADLECLPDYHDSHKVALDRGERAFGRWMEEKITANYENNVQAMAYVGAAFLILMIGLRGIKFVSKTEPTLILLALELEFSLLLLLGAVIFYKPEEIKQGATDEMKTKLEKTEKELVETHKRLEKLENSVEDFKRKFDQTQSALKTDLHKLP
jgi:hypothetical protein